MKLFDRKHRSFGAVFGVGLLMLLLVACGNSGTTTTTSAPTNGKGCTKVGILLPETASSARWDSKDKPLLTSKIQAAVPGATVDYNNAGGDQTTQQTQAESALTKGDCILVVAPHDSATAAT